MLRFMDGFDSYANSDLPLKWSGFQANFGSPSITSPGRYGSGTQALLNQDSAGYVSKSLDNQPTLIVGFAFKFTSLSSLGFGVGSPILRFFDQATGQLELNVNNSGLLSITRNGTLLATGTTMIALAWYYIEFKATISPSIAANSCIVRLGGVNEIVLPAGTNTRASGNSFANAVRFTGQSGGLQIDDIYICDSQGLTNNDFLGDVRVECIRPTGAGNYSQFAQTGGTSPNHWTSVNGTSEDGDTSYLSSNTTGQFDTFTFGSLSSAANSIFGVQTILMARKDDAGSRSIAADVRIGGVDYPGASVGLPDSYVYCQEIRETNPATSAPWTASDVNSLEAGVKIVG